MSCKKFSFLHLLLIFFHILSATVATTNSSDDDDLLYEIKYFLRVYKNGTVERLLGTETVPASLDPATGVESKDIYNIIPNLNISARLYLPRNAIPSHKHPLLVYFHGGAFCTESAFSPTYHNHLNSLVARANVVAVSVNYRLIPENHLPIAYQDSWLALEWVFSHHRGIGREPWLTNYVNFSRVYVGGDSAGGNIAHNMAIRAGLNKTDDHGVDLYGMFLNCPHFWGEELIGNEPSNPEMVAWVESIWIYSYPNTSFDDPLSNPALDPNLSKLGCKKVVVYVAEYDILRDRGYYYRRALRDSKWDGIVNLVDVKGQDHVFNLIYPNSTDAQIILNQLAMFLNPDRQMLLLPRPAELEIAG